MVIIDIRKLNATKAYSGKMQFEYLPKDNLLDIPSAQFDGAVQVQFDYELYEDDSLEIKGSIRYRLVGQCARCLRPAFEEVESELNAYFVPFQTEEDYRYEGGKVDVTEALNDAIVASLPFSLYCKEEDCQMISYDA